MAGLAQVQILSQEPKLEHGIFSSSSQTVPCWLTVCTIYLYNIFIYMMYSMRN